MKKIYLIGDTLGTNRFLSQIRDKKIAYTKDLFVINKETISIAKLNCEYCNIGEDVDAVIFVASANQAINNASCAAIRALDDNIVVDFYHEEIDQPFKMVASLIEDLNCELQKKPKEKKQSAAFIFKDVFHNVITLFGHKNKCENHSENNFLPNPVNVPSIK